jgi:hypothetical protein
MAAAVGYKILQNPEMGYTKIISYNAGLDLCGGELLSATFQY